MRDLEANLQYEYMDKVRGYVKQQEEQIGRPLLQCRLVRG